MNKLLFLITSIFLFFQIGHSQNNKRDFIEISGQVTDFEGNPIDSAMVQLKHSDFSEAYSTYSDANGNYKLTGVKKGIYLAMYVLRPKEYPRKNAVPPEDMRLEFWAWNVIADTNLTINPRYHRLELYGLNAFMVIGGGSGVWLYVRPMSLGKLLKHNSDIYTNKSKSEEVADLNVYPEHFKAEVFVDDIPVSIKSIQKVEEFAATENKALVIGYLINIDLNITKKPERPFKIKVVGENTELKEKGENVCFFKIEDYQ
jgi:hypothetical protein